MTNFQMEVLIIMVIAIGGLMGAIHTQINLDEAREELAEEIVELKNRIGILEARSR